MSSKLDIPFNPATEPSAQGISRDQVAHVDFIFHVASDYTSGVRDQWELLPFITKNRFGRFGWGLNSVEFSFGEDGVADGFRATGGRVRNLRFHRVEELSSGM